MTIGKGRGQQQGVTIRAVQWQLASNTNRPGARRGEINNETAVGGN